MKPLSKYIIIEKKDDNLHQFIQYLKDTGEEGELKSSINSIYDLYQKADPRKSSKFATIESMDLEEEFCDENGLDIDDIDDNYEEYIEYLKERCEDTIMSNLDLSYSKHGCIYIERSIRIPNFTDKDKLYSKLKNTYDGSLGKYWTYMEGMGESYGGYAGSEIIICALVRPEDVNWPETICSNIVDPEEYELTINDNADIQIINIKTKKGNHIIYKPQNLLYKA